MPFDSDPVSIAIEIELQRSKQEVSELTARVAALEAQLKSGTKAKEDFSKAAGNAKSILEGFKGALSQVSPELSNMVGNAQRAAQGLEAMGKASAEIGTSFAAGGALLVGLGLVTVAVGALALAWKDARDRADEAIKKQKEAAGVLAKGEKLAGKMSAEEAEAAYRGGSISAGQYQSVLQGSGTLSSTGIEQAQGLVDAAKGNLTIEGNGWRRRRTSSPELEDAEALLDQRVAEAAAAKVKAVSEDIKKKAQQNAKGTASRVNSIDWNPVEWSGGIQVDALGRNQLPNVEGLPVDTSYPGYIAPRTLDPYAGQPSGGDLLLGGIGRGLGQYGMRTAALAQGDVSGALMGLGPAGAIAGGLQTVGRMGASGVSNQLDGIKDAMIAALEALPDILGDVIPEFVEALVSEFVPALIEGLPGIIKAALVDLPIGIARAIGSALNPFDNGALHNGKKGFGDFAAEWFTLGAAKTDFGGGWGKVRFQTGGRVPSDGLYKLERGEEVIPAMGSDVASSQGRAAKASSMSVGGLHIHAEGAMLGRDWDRDLEDRLSRLFQRFGSGVTSINIGPQGGPVGDAR